jgi:hypothetical protein
MRERERERERENVLTVKILRRYRKEKNGEND